jgi:hypothetical protein
MKANQKVIFMNSELLVKVWLEVLHHPPHSTDLAPSDYHYLFGDIEKKLWAINLNPILR